jgi:hypothetical protein
VNADRWWDYSGPLCDCPGERRGLPDLPALLDDRPDPADLAEEMDDRGVLWEDLAPEERAYLTRMGLR